MSGPIVAYSTNLQGNLNGDQITAMCYAKSYGTGNYWNSFFIGTQSGKLWYYSELDGNPSTPSIQQLTINGSSPGPITYLVTAGQYLYANAPNQVLRMPLNTLTSTSITADKNIYIFGGNTGGITVNSASTVYFVGRNGNSILNTDTWGTGYVDTFFQQPPHSTSEFAGIQIVNTKLYVADPYSGNIYFYDFEAGMNDLQILTTTGFQSKVSSIAFLSDNIFYNRLDAGHQGVYMYNLTTGTSILIAGGGSSTSGVDAQNYQILNPTQVVLDSNGNLYIASTNPVGNPLITKVTFNPLVRSTIAAPVPTPHFPNCGLPAPGNCKKVVIPFNPTTYWGLLSPQRIAIHRPPANIPNCYNTFYQLCPTIPPVRVNPVGPPPTPPPIRPTFSFVPASTSVMASVYNTTIMNALRPTFGTGGSVPSDGVSSRIQMALGPQGYIYFMMRSGLLLVYDTLGGKSYALSKFSNKFSPVSYPPVVSSGTGLVSFITDSKILTVVDETASTIRYSYTLNGQIAGSPAFVDVDPQYYLVAACGNNITAYDTVNNGVIVWSRSLTGDQFASSVTFDGFAVFVGTLGGNIVSYSWDGTFNWTYSLGAGALPPTTPLPSNDFLCFASSNTIYAIDKSSTRGNRGLDTIITLSGLGNLSNTPLIYKDTTSTWMYFVASSRLFGVGIGDVLGTTNTYVDINGGNISGGLFWKSAQTTLTSSTPIIDGSGSLYVSDNSNVYRYTTPWTSSGIQDAAQTQSQSNYFQVTGTVLTPAPILYGKNYLSFIYSNSSLTSNIIVTISST